MTTLFLCGDVMTGRGIDQVLPFPGDPQLHESYVKTAVGYVELAEEANGPIPKPVGFAYVWGEALAELERVKPEARIINLETSITTSSDWEPKGINYRMSPGNIGCLTAARIDCCVLANNHLLDWGLTGLLETLETLKRAGIQVAGTGSNLKEAEAPAVLDLVTKGRVLVVSLASETSGVPEHWAATDDRPGVNFLEEFSTSEVHRVKATLASRKRPGDIAVASIHWGGNWGYDIPESQRWFAHALIDDAGVDVVHGHSSHHPKAFELYEGKLILYGCGDFLNDYEGITGYEQYRGDLSLMYFADIAPENGKLTALRLVPLQTKRFQLVRAAPNDAQWLAALLNREGKQFSVHVSLQADNSISLSVP